MGALPLGVHWLWAKSFPWFKDPQPDAAPVVDNVQIGVGPALTHWWHFLQDTTIGFAEGEHMVRFACEHPEVPCETRIFHEWGPAAGKFQDLWRDSLLAWRA